MITKIDNELVLDNDITELLKTEKLQLQVFNRKITVINEQNESGTAVCCYGDIFDLRKGIEIALAHLKHKSIKISEKERDILKLCKNLGCKYIRKNEVTVGAYKDSDDNDYDWLISVDCDKLQMFKFMKCYENIYIDDLL